MFLDEHFASQRFVFERQPRARFFELFVQSSVLDCDRSLVAKRLEEVEVLLRKEMPRLTMIDVDRAGGALLDDQRHADDRQNVLRDDRLRFGEAFVGARVGRHDRLTGLNHFLDDRLR